MREEYKRIFDIAFSLCVILLCLPLYFLIALLIKCSSPGPIFYSQKRVGKGGKLFSCWKFRTMHPNAESSLDQILRESPKLRAEWRAFQKLQDDPRVFPFGRFLRKCSLDELPQFFNVLLGDLSVVGPRPYQVEQIPQLGNRASLILSIRPGITGLWQTSGRSRRAFRERISLDACYVRTHSFGKDLVLIGKTLPLLLFTKDAC